MNEDESLLEGADAKVRVVKSVLLLLPLGIFQFQKGMEGTKKDLSFNSILFNENLGEKS